MMPLRLFVVLGLAASAFGAARVDDRECEVCKAVIATIDEQITETQRKTPEGIEDAMQTYCDTAKGKDKTMCYYMGVGDKEMGTAGGVKREISASLGRGINSKRLCKRLMSKDAQMCELRYDKKVDVKNVDLKKLRVKELRKICDDEGIGTKGLAEKDEFVKKIREKFGLKEEM